MTSRLSSSFAFTSSRSDTKNVSSVLGASCSRSRKDLQQQVRRPNVVLKDLAGLSMVHSRMMTAPSSMHF